MQRGNLGSFTTPLRLTEIALAPMMFGLLQRKCHISNSSEEEGEVKGSPLAQLLWETLECNLETFASMRLFGSDARESGTGPEMVGVACCFNH